MAVTHHILLLGGTGLCGQIFIQAALEAGHKLTLYCRTPSKLCSEIASHPNVTAIEGKLGDVEGLKKAAGCGADVFVSLAGPTLGKREGTVCTSPPPTAHTFSIGSKANIVNLKANNQLPAAALSPPARS
jgi:putative NADH-flavin reductase